MSVSMILLRVMIIIVYINKILTSLSISICDQINFLQKFLPKTVKVHGHIEDFFVGNRFLHFRAFNGCQVWNRFVTMESQLQFISRNERTNKEELLYVASQRMHRWETYVSALHKSTTNVQRILNSHVFGLLYRFIFINEPPIDYEFSIFSFSIDVYLYMCKNLKTSFSSVIKRGIHELVSNQVQPTLPCLLSLISAFRGQKIMITYQ